MVYRELRALILYNLFEIPFNAATAETAGSLRDIDRGSFTQREIYPI